MEIRYYDSGKKDFIDLSNDSCDLADWKDNDENGYLCCKHPNGFYVFLNSKEIDDSDEYSTEDPYIQDISSASHKKRFKCVYDLIDNWKEKDDLRLLDIGCGRGYFTAKLKEEFPSFTVSGLDYSISAIDFAHSSNKDIDFIVADAYLPPYEDDCFDIVICNNLWEHVPDPLNLLNAISRILKTNGLLIISTPSRYRLSNLVRVLFGREISLITKQHVTEYTVGQVIEQLRYGGYKIRKITYPLNKEKRLSKKILKYLLYKVIGILKSHHVLDQTVFFSAIKRPKVK